jgi:putative hydrolase of the HAD superfamily
MALIKAVTFDLWNTLIVERSYTDLRVKAFREVLLGQGISRGREEILEAYEVAAERYNRMWAEEHRHFSNRERLALSLKLLGIDLPTDAGELVIRRWEDAFLLEPPSFNDGAKEVVKELSRRLRLGIISDTGVTPGSVIRRFLAERGLLGFFHATIFSDEIGYCKPDERAFGEALRQLGVIPREAAHIGDLLRTDVAGAKAAGMRAIWLNVKGQAVTEGAEPDHVVTSLSQLTDILLAE